MEQQKGLTGSTLKIIAMVTMLIDHIGASILERGSHAKGSRWQCYGCRRRGNESI